MSSFNHNMILSASGWRKIFAYSQDETDSTPEIGDENTHICVLSARVFSDFVKSKTAKQHPSVIVGTDTRPTGPKAADAVIRALLYENCAVKYAGVAAAPEIMAGAKQHDGFIYISASHNPVGHNGIKFGLNDGGVLNAEDNARLAEDFARRCTDENELKTALRIETEDENTVPGLKAVRENVSAVKAELLSSYAAFAKNVISSEEDSSRQDAFFEFLKNQIQKHPVGIVCDMNGSARSVSIDRDFFKENSLPFYPFNDVPGKIAHEIIPEPENLVHCARKMEELQKSGVHDAVLGYMPDCDGDRGNIVFWDHGQNKAVILKAQEVFSLSVLAELAFSEWLSGKNSGYKPAVAVNCPTSRRIDDIAECFGAKVFRGEVGEANVVNTACLARNDGWNIRILGEGSNGGTITFPSKVRDPLNTIFAFIKLLAIRDTSGSAGVKPGLFHIWCERSNQIEKYKEDFTLSDIIRTLPVYTTTGVSEPRAVLKIRTQDHAVLKSRFQKIFENSWKNGADGLLKKYAVSSYKCIITNGTVQKSDVTDFSQSKKGGLKIQFYERGSEKPSSFIWMRGSGTESVFRVLCDVKGDNPEKEKELLAWETKMILEADAQDS